ncbi:MAG: cell division protein FtsL [Syntrophorhabdales bacterium]|jgi:cell division protein FtsL
MITRAVSGRHAYIRVEHTRYMQSRLSPLCVVGAVLACAALVLAFFFLTGAYEETRGRFMERLKMEKELVEVNKALKMELAAVTQKGYVEFAARERLGLKRPNDKEVVVLR